LTATSRRGPHASQHNGLNAFRAIDANDVEADRESHLTLQTAAGIH
jgi:hypothetical protein